MTEPLHQRLFREMLAALPEQFSKDALSTQGLFFWAIAKAINAAMRRFWLRVGVLVLLSSLGAMFAGAAVALFVILRLPHG